MMTLTLILLVVFFVLALILRSIALPRLCALCASVVLTWVTLWVLAFTRGGADPIIVAILMGGSVVGVIYYLSAKLPERFALFKFALLVTLVWLVHVSITGPQGALSEGLIILVVWAASGVIAFAYKNDRLTAIGKKLIECCKNW